MDEQPTPLPDPISSLIHSLLPPLQSLHTTINPPTLPTLPSPSTLNHASSSLYPSLPPTPLSPSSLLTHLSSHLLPGLSHSSLSPHYYGFVTGGCTPAALLGDVLASIYDQNVQVHLPGETVATEVEGRALGMVRELVRLGDGGLGWGNGKGHALFTTGATAGNVLGLAMGREAVLRDRVAAQGKGEGCTVSKDGLYEAMLAAGVKKVQVLTTMPHSSIGKAASIVGLGRGNVLSICRTDDKGEQTIGMDMELLQRKLAEPSAATIVVISAGEVNTGHFATNGADMKRLRELCDEYSAWIHVDGAFGLFGRIFRTEADREEFGEIVRGCEGLELADSIAGDAHKLLNVPYDCGFFFSRHRDVAGEVFKNANAAYLDTGSDDVIPSPLNYGLENSRRFRALPAYCSLLAYGREGYTDMLRRQIRLAREVVSHLWDSRTYRIMPEGVTREEALRKTFIIVLFRATDDALNDVLVKKVNATRKIYVSGTVWKGQKAARIAISNWQVDVERDIVLIKDVLRDVAAT